jgi:hypothetical protein
VPIEEEEEEEEGEEVFVHPVSSHSQFADSMMRNARPIYRLRLSQV